MDDRNKKSGCRIEFELMKATTKGIIHEYKKKKLQIDELSNKVELLAEESKKSAKETRTNRNLVIISMIIGIVAEIISNYWSVK